MSDIEWTDETWNPVVGCDHVSEGCRNCYAETMSNRLASMEHSEQYDDVVDDKGRFAGGTVNTVPKMLEKPLGWKKPRRVFVNSMSDLFHPDVPFEFVDKVFAVMALADQHTFQILTKRPERMREYFGPQPRQDDWPSWWDDERDRRFAVVDEIDFDFAEHDTGRKHALKLENNEWPLPNVWLGVSVEDKEAADKRIPPLLECPAEVRFLSCEPLLGPVDLEGGETYPKKGWLSGFHVESEHANGCRGECRRCPVPVRVQNPGEIDWVIAGGESGPGARPMHPDWVRSLRDQCDEAGVPFFFKQHGAWRPVDEDADVHEPKEYPLKSVRPVERQRSEGDWPENEFMVKVGKDEAGRELDGTTHDEFPEVPDPC